MTEKLSTINLTQVAMAMLLNGADSPEFKQAGRNFLLTAVNEKITSGIAELKEHDHSGITAGAVDYDKLEKNIQAFAAIELLKLWPD